MSNYVKFKNANIHFTDVGKGNTIVLLHGFLENSTMWNNLVPEISKRNRVISIDLLGHGKTASIGYVHTMEMMAAAVETVLKKLRLRRYIVVGHFNGGLCCFGTR